MKLIVPYVGQLQPLDSRILRLAEFMGIAHEAFGLTKASEPTDCLEKTVTDSSSCLVINPQVMREWLGPNGFSPKLVDFLLSRFTHIFVHGVRVDSFDSEMVAALSRSKLQSVDAVTESHPTYKVARNSKDICEAFSGLEFGPANPANDHVFRANVSDPAVQALISIGELPFMAKVKLGGAEVLFLAGEDVVDLNTAVGDEPLVNYFSRFLPHAMALRSIAGDECWRPSKACAAIIIDDPLLRRKYGFLDLELLLRLADQHKFHAVIAFIPHNFRRSSSRITQMFLKSAARLSICFHGNDHTEAEFASADPVLLNTLLRTAENRMSEHQRLTGLPCDRVMVFPQGNFSTAAMRVLQSHNFYGAVNTVPYPVENPLRLTIGELAQPAILRYGAFPLFLRNPIRKIQDQDIAFNLFFGRPILIVEHHEVFQRPSSLVEIATRINSVASKIEWARLATALASSILVRKAPDGTRHVRAYSNTAVISNDSSSPQRYLLEWESPSGARSIDQILADGNSSTDFQVEGTRLVHSFDLPAACSRTVSLVHRNSCTAVKRIGLRRNAKAFLRRRLSEVRDNYLSKNQHLLDVARALHRRFS